MIRPFILICFTFLFFNPVFSQLINPEINENSKEVYPYRLPIWGQKAVDKGYGDQLQLPLGFNLNYINAFIDMEITAFELKLGDTDLTGIINPETLNFKEVSATTNGVNFRADAWILPFLNVYALFSKVAGGTNVVLEPTWRDADGDIILQLPEFKADVNFDAVAYGVGSSLVFGVDNYFLNSDINYSATATELLEKNVGFLTLSARAGYKFDLRSKTNDRFIAAYVGMMYRDFVGAKGSNGSIQFNEVFPNIDNVFNDKVDTKIAENEAEIENLNPILDASEIVKLKAQNQFLTSLQNRINDNEVFSTNVNYFIKKDLIQTSTFQFGFNFQINKQWMLRGEYGVSASQRFLLTGLQYRFGISK